MGALWFDWTWQTSLIAFGSQRRGSRLCPKDGERGRDGAKTATSGTNNGVSNIVGGRVGGKWLENSPWFWGGEKGRNSEKRLVSY